jgi:hypothetical protein
MILFPWNSQNQDSFLTSLICHSRMEASHMYQNSLICDSHTYKSRPILFEPSFSSELFENYADKTNPTQSGTIMSIISMIFVAFLKTQISTLMYVMLLSTQILTMSRCLREFFFWLQNTNLLMSWVGWVNSND